MSGFGLPVTASFAWVANPAVAYSSLRWLRDGDVDVAAALGAASWGTLDLELLDPDAHLTATRTLVLDLDGDNVPSKGGAVISDDARHYVVTNRTAQPVAFEGEWFDKYSTRFTAPVVGATAPLVVAPSEALHFTANRTALTVVQRVTAVSWQQRLINRESSATPTVTPTVTVASEAALAGVTAGPNNSFVKLDDGANPVRWFERVDGELVEQGGGGAWQTEPFTATAGQVSYTLATAPATPANTRLSLRGAPRDFGTDFTVAGTTVTLTMPGVTVFAGDNVIVQHD